MGNRTHLTKAAESAGIVYCTLCSYRYRWLSPVPYTKPLTATYLWALRIPHPYHAVARLGLEVLSARVLLSRLALNFLATCKTSTQNLVGHVLPIDLCDTKVGWNIVLWRERESRGKTNGFSYRKLTQKFTAFVRPGLEQEQSQLRFHTLVRRSQIKYLVIFGRRAHAWGHNLGQMENATLENVNYRSFRRGTCPAGTLTLLKSTHRSFGGWP